MFLRSLALGGGATAVAAGLTAWLALLAGPDAVRPVIGLGAGAVVVLVVSLAAGRPEPFVVALALLGAAYAAILAIDDPPLNLHAAVVGASLLALGELAYLSVETRYAVTEEAGAVARRVASVTVLALLALSIGAAILALVDLLRTGGIAIEVFGVAAAAAAIGLLVVAAHDAREE